MMETREITVTIHREPEKRDDLLATLLIVVLAALAFTAGYIAANAQWRETISEVTPEPPVVAQETRAKLLTSYEEPTESITTSRYAEVSQEDCELIAKIVYLEARGDPLEGQQAVAEVILNRVAADNFPDSVEEVIFQGTDGSGAVQFSTAAHLDEAAPTDKQFAAVGQALYGEPVLPMDVVFFSTAGENSRTWGAIGGHIFCYQYEWE
jgi:spore germination cell wall hydrolase CwlJ-like protein